MLLKHGFDRGHNVSNLGRVAVTQAEGFIDAAIGHSRRIFQNNRVEHGVGNIKRPFIKSANFGKTPAYVFNSPFYLPIGRTHPVTNRKRSVQVDHQAAEKICKQILGRKADSYTTDTAKS